MYNNQVYAVAAPRRVGSLSVCNGFCSTPYSIVGTSGTSVVVSLLPTRTLQQIVLASHVYDTDVSAEYQKKARKGATKNKKVVTKEAFRKDLVAEAESWVKRRLLAEKSIDATALASKVGRGDAGKRGMIRWRDFSVVLQIVVQLVPPSSSPRTTLGTSKCKVCFRSHFFENQPPR